MHKEYRDLQERVEAGAAASPELKALVDQVGEVDDLDPLRVNGLKGMRRGEPLLELNLERSGDELVLLARNTQRKRRAQQLTRCASISCPSWLFDPEAAVPPELTAALRLDILRMIRESFTLLGTRIGVYFRVGFRHELAIEQEPVAHFYLKERPLAERFTHTA